MKNSKLLLSLSIGLVMFLCSHCYAQEPLLSEYKIKAAFLFNFLKFIKSELIESPSKKNVTICIFSTSDYYRAFESIDKQRVRGWTTKVVYLEDLSEINSCDIAFVSRFASIDIVEFIEETAGNGILTVAEVDDFCEAGGMINFYYEYERIRFEINLDRARSEGINISSKLLRLARVID